jgi:hypothetical protein
LTDEKHQNQADATEALRLADDLIPRLQSREDRAAATFYKAQALGELGQTTQSCAVIREMKESGLANGTRFANSVESVMQQVCGQ